MGKTTQPVKATVIISGFTFFSFLLLSASNSTPTEPIIAERFTEENFVAEKATEIEEGSNLNSPKPGFTTDYGESEVICSVTAPPNVSAATSDDGTGDCTTTVELGEPDVTACFGFSAKPFVNGNEIDPETFAFPAGTTIVVWRIVDGLSLVESEPQEVQVSDDENPTIVTQDKTVQLNTNGTASIIPANINNGSSDNCGIDSYSLDIDTFSCADVGSPVSVTLTVKDVNGNVNSGTATVTVMDNIAPTAVTQNIIAELDSNGITTITAADVDAGSSDACGIVNLSLDKTSFDCTNIGPNQVTLTITDENGNSTSQSATVTVMDNIAPTAATQNITVQLDSNGTASITAADIDNGSSDACGITNMNLDITSFDCTNMGPNQVTLTVTDENENSTSQTATVTVRDNIAPTVVTQNIAVQLGSNGTASITTADIDNGSSDACGIGSMSLDNTNFDCTHIGSNTVILTVTDINGQVSTATAIVTVEDTTDPSIIAPSDIITAKTSDDNTGNCSTTVAIGTPVVSDNCENLSVKAFIGGSEIDPGTHLFPVGTTTIVWTVSDSSGNSASDSQVVTVKDDESPVLSVPNNLTVGVDTNSCSATEIALGEAIVTDNCSTSFSITNDAPNTFPLGKTTVKWTATDEVGNSTTASQIVTVVDNQNPTINAPGNITHALTSNNGTGDCFTTVALGNPVFNDNCGTPTLKIYINGSPINPHTHLFPKGSTSVTWEATDKFGNKTEAIQVVTVHDDEAPVISPPSDVTAGTSDDGKGNCSTSAKLGFPSISDNCNSISTKAYIGNTQIDPDLHKFPIGTTVVTWTATDPAGNKSSAEQKVIVKDNEAPIPGNLSAITWGCTLTVPQPVATDNCDNDVTVTANRSATFSNSGTIVWTFTDDHGNQSTAEQTIYISNLQATVDATRTTVYGRNDGTARVYSSGGIAPFTYEWRKVGSPNIVSASREAINLSAGNYEITIKDVNGCSITKPVEIINAVLPEHIATSACYDVKDYVRTSTFQIDLNNVVGGVGDPANFIYEWNFGADATPVNALGPEEHTVTWEAQGDKTVYLTITDERDYEQSFAIQHYVGGCFEGCGATSNFVMDTSNFFIGDKDGNPLTGTSCEETTEKYMWIDITDNANGYALSAEMNYAVNNGQETVTGKAIGCFSEIVGYDNKNKPIYNKIPTGLFRLFPVQESGNDADKITWQCGSTFMVEGINIRWTNQENMGCNEGTKPMCYGPETQVMVNTPLMVEATPENVLCKGEATGIISVRASGGKAPYTYSVDGPVSRTYQDSQHFYNLPAGDYTFSAKDTDTIITSGTLRISEPATKVEATVKITKEILCYGETGEAQVTATGGTPPYFYSWSTGAVTRTADGLLADIPYTVTVTDNNGCKATSQVVLTQPFQLTSANAGLDQSHGCGITTTTLSANAPSSGEKGKWEIISGANGTLTTVDLINPNAPFTGIPGESYVLRWTISTTDDTCPNSDLVTISFAEECSTLNFDGIDDYVVMGDEYDLGGSDFTLEAWVRPKSVNGTKTILSKRNTGNMTSGGYDLSITNGAVSFGWNSNRVFTTSKVGTDRWYHVAVIFSGQAPKILVDGIPLTLQYDISNAGAPSPNGHPFMIGAANYAHTPERPKNQFHGWIEEVRIWETALSIEQLRFMMNQRVEKAPDAQLVKGEILPMNVPGSLLWSNLSGYYRLNVTEVDTANGTTPDIATNTAPGFLRNIEEKQENSAPLPYISGKDGNWWNPNSWKNPDYWDPPNSSGINGEKIEWNIAWVTDSLNSGNRDIKLLGLLVKSGKVDMLGVNPTSVTRAGTGNGLTITKYLDLDGFLDLNGESQLVQTVGSILEGSGRLERDQQGTGSSYNYNYFSSPVSTLGSAPNSGYTVAGVLRSGSDPAKPSAINFNYQYHYADGAISNPLKISTYWLYKFHGTAGEYNQWHWIGQDGHLEAGEGYTMKGSSGHLNILDLQNYVFSGMPNNGSLSFSLGRNENRLIGNPYPSAIDAKKFIEQNLKDSNGDYVFNGSLYFWSHFKGKTHYLTRYEGGYAIYNLMGSAKAVANDARINATGEIGGMEPQQYIPPGQAFFINSVADDEVPDGTSKLPLPIGMVGGEIRFHNSQRAFRKEDPAQSVFHSKEKPQVENSRKNPADKIEKETRKRIWLKSKSPMGYHRQLLVGADSKASLQFDPGYDAPVHDDVEEDMYWQLNHMELVIQGVPQFHKGIELPLGMKAKKEGEFTIEIDKLENIPDDFAILLKDTLDKKLHDLRKSKYQFTASPERIDGRFSILFLNDKESEEEVEENSAFEEIDLFYSREEEAINILNPHLVPLRKAALYNLNGQHLRKYDYVPTEEGVKLAVPLRTTGVYIFRLQTDQGTRVLKFIIE